MYIYMQSTESTCQPWKLLCGAKGLEDEADQNGTLMIRVPSMVGNPTYDDISQSNCNDIASKNHGVEGWTYVSFASQGCLTFGQDRHPHLRRVRSGDVFNSVLWGSYRLG